MRKIFLEILAQEMERADNLPPGANKLIADLREDKNVGAGFEAALRAMARAASEKVK